MSTTLKQVRRLKFIDNCFRRLIVLGGLITIVCVLLILWSIIKITFPLFKQNKVIQYKLKNFDLNKILLQKQLFYSSADDYLENIWGITRDGELFLWNLENQQNIQKLNIVNGTNNLDYIDSVDNQNFMLRFASSQAQLWQLGSRKQFTEAGVKEYKLNANKLASFPELDRTAKNTLFYDTARQRSDDIFLRVSLASKTIILHWLEEKTDFVGDVSLSQNNNILNSKLKGKIVAAFLSRNGEYFYLSDSNREIEVWDLKDLDDIKIAQNIKVDEEKIVSSFSTIFGDTSLLVGFSDGSVEIFTFIRQKLKKIHLISTKLGSIKNIIPSLRNKSFITVGESSSSFWYLTGATKLLDLNLNTDYTQISFNPSGTAITTLKDKDLKLWEIEIPYPQFNLKTIFNKTQYEGYLEPDYIWQSSSGNDDFEPKYSFIPLIIGSLKGTIYAMFFALPLAILGAIYINQFAKPWLRNIVKPAVEIMATIPSVVIGFLAALWLAPLIEKHLVALLIYFAIFPAIFIFCYFVITKFISNFNRKFGKEFLLVIPSFILCFLITSFLAPLFNNLFFDKDFVFWLSNTLGLVYEQRNAIVISFALGFAVIPIIFTMTDEALSSFPKNIIAGSLALGANHWQTLTRVILPTTSSGIFAGFIIGFGRAIGETMIVLMATGNSPITSWSFFNGMRTIAANIAVEIPEAPFEGTLYRILFLSAVLLFLFTFSLNLLAELIRYRLRKKYRI